MLLRKEDHVTYSMIPGPLAEEVCQYLSNNGYEYQLLKGAEIPSHLERTVDMDGHKQTRGVCCIKSMLNEQDVNQLMLRIWSPSWYGDPEEE